MKFWGFKNLFSVFFSFTGEWNSKYRMGPWRLTIHLGLSDVSTFHSSVKHIHKLVTVKGSLFSKILNKHTFFGILSDVEFFLFFWFQEIHNLFIVQFKIGASDQALSIFHPVDSREEFVKRLLHKSIVFANHCMSLSGSCLTVYKDTGVVSVKYVVYKFMTDMMKNVSLGCAWREDLIKSKLMPIKFDLCFGVSENGLLMSHRFYPNEDLDRILAWNWVHFGML